MDINHQQAQRIYDVFLWLNAPNRPPAASLQLLNDIADIQNIIAQNYSQEPFDSAKRLATTAWMTRHVFPQVKHEVLA